MNKTFYIRNFLILTEPASGENTAVGTEGRVPFGSVQCPHVEDHNIARLRPGTRMSPPHTGKERDYTTLRDFTTNVDTCTTIVSYYIHHGNKTQGTLARPGFRGGHKGPVPRAPRF